MLRLIQKLKNQRLPFAGLLGLCVVFAGSPEAKADRNLEVGGFVGAHFFNDNNELGIYDGDNDAALDHSFTLGLRAAVGLPANFDLEAELAFAPTGPRAGSDVNVTALGWRAHGLYHIDIRRENIRPFVLAGAGGSSSFSEDTALFRNDTDFVIHAGAGVKVEIKDGWGARLDLRLLLPPSDAGDGLTADGEVLVGFYKEFDFEEVIIKDSDADGIRDRDDACPNEAEDMDGFEDTDGCPEDQDSDSDGIADSKDECPQEAEDMDGFEDDDGCPETDNDSDGIEDGQDKCPLEAEDMDGFEDEDGCPEPDNDGDGIADGDDKCPTEPETANGFEDADGCPDELPEVVKKFSGEIKGIRFQRGSAKIRSVSFPILDAAVAVFTEYGDLNFEVQGHTDNTGTPERNKQLSQERAESVKAYLVSKGISADRITATGFGQDVPVQDNATKPGREANRRVEFKLVNK